VAKLELETLAEVNLGLFFSVSENKTICQLAQILFHKVDSQNVFICTNGPIQFQLFRSHLSVWHQLSLMGKPCGCHPRVALEVKF
jgi:hypothetical protein